MTSPTPRRPLDLLRRHPGITLALMAVVLVVVFWHIGSLLLSRHHAADRCRAAGYTWLGGYVNKCIDAPVVNP